MGLWDLRFYRMGYSKLQYRKLCQNDWFWLRSKSLSVSLMTDFYLSLYVISLVVYIWLSWALNYDIRWLYGDVGVMVLGYGLCLPEWTTEGQHCCVKWTLFPIAGEKNQPRSLHPDWWGLGYSNESHDNDQYIYISVIYGRIIMQICATGEATQAEDHT